MRVLITYSNRIMTQDLPLLAFPSGPAYVAGTALAAGHEVEVFDASFSEDVSGELSARIRRFEPDIVAVSIRNVFGGLLGDLKDLRPEISEIVDTVRGTSEAPIVLGGSGFNNFAGEWLEYLGVDYGIRGEGEVSFSRYLEIVGSPKDIREIPGCTYRENGDIRSLPCEPIDDLDSTPLPAFNLLDIERYQSRMGFPSIYTKRGCAFHCSHCPIRALEGKNYRLKSPERVVEEIERAREGRNINMFYFVDNLFNFPKSHAEAICERLIELDLGITWTSDSLTPLGMTEELCRLIKDSGCGLPTLAIEHGSAAMLKRMRRGYRQDHIAEAMENLDRVSQPFMISLLLGGPGETEETIEEALQFIESQPRPQVIYVTIGLSLEHNQGILKDALEEGAIESEADLFKGSFYLSPALTEGFIRALVDRLKAKSGWFVWGF